MLAPTVYAVQMREAERQLKLALKAENMDEIQAALREMTKLTRRQHGVSHSA